MSSTTESLLFKVNVSQSGMTTTMINQLSAALKNLGAVKISGGTGSAFNQIETGAKAAVTAIDQLTTKVKTMGTAVSGASTSFTPLNSAMRTFATNAKSVETSMTGIASGAGRAVSSINQIANAFTSANGPMNTFAANAKKVGDAFLGSSTVFTSLNTTIKTLQGAIERLIVVPGKIGNYFYNCCYCNRTFTCRYDGYGCCK